MADGKRERSPQIGTHDGTFHCDEVLGCALLRRTKAFADADIVRTRDAETLAGCDIVIDVGATYDAAERRFDHHQRDFTTTWPGRSTTKLSSAGLVYLHYGKEILAATLGDGETADSPLVALLHELIYVKFVEAVDAIDNGVGQYDTDKPARYISSTGLGSRIAGLNPSWNEENSSEVQLQRFNKGMDIAGAEFTDCVNYYAKSWMPARVVVEEAVDGRTDIHPSGQIIKMGTFAPWKNHLFDVEKEKGVDADKQILYCLFQDSKGGWRIQCVPPSPDSFACRKALPEPWRGVRDQALSDLTGVPGCVFVHAGGFIGGVNSYEGALKLATMSLEA